GIGVMGAVALLGLGLARAFRGLRAPRLPPLGWALGTLTAMVAVRLAAQVWLFAPYSGDVLSYHLPKVAEWVRAGHFTREMGVDSHATFPAGFELVETWWVVFLHHDVLIEMAGVEFLSLALAAVVALATEIGLSAPAAGFAGLVYVLTPGFHVQVTSCLNDAPAAALVLATAALIVGRAPLGLIALVAGLGIGVKP